MDKFKPGVEGIVLLFSDNEGNVVYEFPMYQTMREELEPLLLEVSNIVVDEHQQCAACLSYAMYVQLSETVVCF